VSEVDGGPLGPGKTQVDDWQSLVESLDLSESLALNDMVCARIDYLRARETSRELAKFSVGDMVSFQDKQGALTKGRVYKLNRKSVGVIGDSGGRWTVSPGLLTHVEPTAIAATAAPVEVAEKKLSPELEWVCSTLTFPGAVEEDGGYFLPKTAVWMDGNGLIRHVQIFKPGDETAQILDSFDAAKNSPAAGPPCVPLTIRSDKPAVIEALRGEYPSIQYAVGEVPELAEVIEEFNKNFGVDEVPTYRELKIDETVIASFHDAAAQLFESKPWEFLPSELCLVGVSIEDLGIKNSVISVIGQQGLNYGVLLFDSITDYQMYGLAATQGTEAFNLIPAHKVLSFEKGETISQTLRKEIMEHGWTVANSNAYPELFLPIGGGAARPPKSEDLLLFEIISRGLKLLAENRREISKSWATAESFSISHRVNVSSGSVEICFNLPVTPDNKTVQDLDAFEQMALLDHSDLSDSEDRYFKLVDEVTALFEVSKECLALKVCTGGHTLLMELGFNYLRLSPASLLPMDVEEILYELIPRKVMVQPEAAEALIEDCRAFYKFLKREYNHPFADQCLEILGTSAKKRLTAALSDNNKFGMAKSMFAGNTSIMDGLPLFQSYSGADDYGGGATVKPTVSQQKARKKKRKNARKSRKRNRK